MDSSLRAESARPIPPCWNVPTFQHPEQGIVSTSAVHHITAGRSVSPFNDGDWPRGDPEAYFVEPDEIEAGPGLLQGLFASQPAWRREALCGDHPLALFYPERGQSNKPGLAVCAACPVRRPCLAEALDDPTLDHGTRGGMTARARVAARKAQAVDGTERAA
jgi:WhiB family redox-sensing transcriptional regulator